MEKSANSSSSPSPRRAPAEPAAALLAGRYRVESCLGKGGAGAVYRVFDTSGGRWLALKRLSPGASRRLSALFELEYYTLSSLRHPNIVEVYDYAADAEGPYYTMELLEGADLGELAPLPWAEACRYASDAAAALGVLHARRLIHRDVSPRNLRRTPHGSVKLFDFGALAAFGAAGDLVGTPPFVAPEALHRQVLDERVDLYALGALLYQLITGAHAYPARSLRALPELWARPYESASQRVRALARADLPLPPAELDALIEALLSQNPTARPRSTADLLDRLSALAGIARAPGSSAAHSTLQRGAFVGRKRERRHFRRLQQQALAGRGGTFLIESRAGEGRSRLLEELALDARIAGATVLRAHVRAGREARELLPNLALELLDALPELAREGAGVHVPLLATLAPELAQRLEGAPAELPSVPGEARALQHEALCAWFVEVARRAPLLLLVDDLDHADEASQAWLASLGTLAQTAPLLLVAALRSDAQREPGAALRLLRQSAQRVTLRPFSSEEALELLRSMFGGAEHLTRLADRVRRVSQGNPAHMIEQLEHFLRGGLIDCVDGAWVLPQEIPEEQLVHTRAEALEARVSRLSPEARALARKLSLRRGLIPLELCLVLAQSGETGAPAQDQPERSHAVFGALETLVREGVLLGAGGGYRFADDACRTLLSAELGSAERASCHARLGRFLLSAQPLDAVEELEACVHLLQSGDSLDAERRIAQLARRLTVTEPDNAGPSIAALEQALALYRERGRDEYERLPLQVVLARCGYYVDRRYLARYGDETLRLFERTLRLGLARRLRPVLGKRLSLIAALLVAGIGFARRRKNPRVHGLRETIVSFFGYVAALSGVHTVCVDPERAESVARLLEPWTALGKRHTATFMYQFALNLAATVRDRLGEAHAAWQRMIVQLDDPAELPWLNPELRLRYLGGALYAFGVLECWRDGSGALAIAERLEQTGMKLYEMSADQLRTAYYANQGNLELFEKYRERAELHAIRRGSAWQVETWAPMAAITPFMRVYDALGLKQSLEQIQRLSKSIPSLALGATRARGAYQLLRRRYKEALPWLEEALAETPLAVVGWARSLGALACAYNALGEHERARDLCARTLAQLTPADLEFPAMTLSLQIERALAEAGLGEVQRGAELLERLLEQHAPGNGPLTLGALHEARARVAMLAGDEVISRKHLAEMDARYRSSGIPSLVARCETFGRELRKLFRAQDPALPGAGDLVLPMISSSLTQEGVTQIERALSDLALPRAERCARALALLAEHAGLPLAGLWLLQAGHGELVAKTGELPGALDLWVAERLLASQGDNVTHTDFEGPESGSDPNRLRLDGQSFRLFEITQVADGLEQLLGAVVFAEQPGRRAFVSVDLLRAVAGKLTSPTTVRLSREAAEG